MLGYQIAKISCPVFLVLAAATAGIVAYAIARDCTFEVKSPFFGEWKVTSRKGQAPTTPAADA